MVDRRLSVQIDWLLMRRPSCTGSSMDLGALSGDAVGELAALEPRAAACRDMEAFMGMLNPGEAARLPGIARSTGVSPMSEEVTV